MAYGEVRGEINWLAGWLALLLSIPAARRVSRKGINVWEKGSPNGRLRQRWLSRKGDDELKSFRVLGENGR